MNINRSLNNTQGGFVKFLIMIVLLIALMNYLGISLDQVFNFITEILNFFLQLIQTLLAALTSLIGQSPQMPQ